MDAPVARFANFITMFKSISRLFLLCNGPKSIAKLDGGHGQIYPTGSATGCMPLASLQENICGQERIQKTIPGVWIVYCEMILCRYRDIATGPTFNIWTCSIIDLVL